MKKCELCSKVARMYCDSDQATLCWDCDSRVHAANFLVSKHVRTLLCHSCQSPTPWTGSGPRLGPTVSVCEACVDGRDRNVDRGRRNGNTEDEDADDEENIADCDRDDDDDGENQVVPLSLPQSTPSASSGSERSSSRSSGLGLFSGEQSSRFSYHASGRSEPKNATQNNRSYSWRWR